MNVPLGAVENVHVYLLANPPVVQGTVPVRNAEAAVALNRGQGAGKESVKVRVLFAQIPHLQKHQRKTPGGFAFDHQGGVLPVAEPGLYINIFVCQIHAAGEGGVAVDDRDLPVISIIIMCRYKRHHRRKDLAGNAQLIEHSGIVPGQQHEFAESVVYDPDIHALGCLPGQDLQNPAPHDALLHDEVLQEDEFFCLLQFQQKPAELIFSLGEVDGVGAGAGGKVVRPPQIAGKSRRSGSRFFKGGGCRGILGQQIPGREHQVPYPLLQRPMTHITADIKVQCRADQG